MKKPAPIAASLSPRAAGIGRGRGARAHAGPLGMRGGQLNLRRHAGMDPHERRVGFDGRPRTGMRACAGCEAGSRLIRSLSIWQRTRSWPDGVPNSAPIATFAMLTITPRL